MNKNELEAIAEEITKATKYLQNASKMIEKLPDDDHKKLLSSYITSVGLSNFYLGLGMASIFSTLSDNSSSTISTKNFNELMKRLMREKENDSESETDK